MLEGPVAQEEEHRLPPKRLCPSAQQGLQLRPHGVKERDQRRKARPCRHFQLELVQKLGLPGPQVLHVGGQLRHTVAEKVLEPEVPCCASCAARTLTAGFASRAEAPCCSPSAKRVQYAAKWHSKVVLCAH